VDSSQTQKKGNVRRLEAVTRKRLVKSQQAGKYFVCVLVNCALSGLSTYYEGEPVKRSQMDIKHVIFETGKKHLFLDISSTNIDTLVPSLYQCVETRCLLTVVSATSALPFKPLHHQRNVCHPAVNHFTQQTLSTLNRKHFFMNILLFESFCPQKHTTESCSSVVYPPNTATI
jgi:hypothetical protein